MPAGIVYLDIDDEITSAATRIRDVPGRRVALVLPYGSRVATSRINFRLLSRDALINEKQLAVVAGDSATRALAASAGLPVFASVGEYESSLAGAGEEPTAPPPAVATPAPAAAAATTTRAQRGPKSKTPAPGAGADVTTTDAAISGLAGPAAAGGGAGPSTGEETIPFEVPRERQTLVDRSGAEPRSSAGPPATYLPPTRSASRRGSRLPLVIALAALGLVVLVGGVGAYVVLPSVTIVVTPRAESLVPLDIIVTADPTATEPDAAARVVPADIVSVEVIAEDTFPATGKRVEETAAKGTVRFSNLDFLRTNTVPGGSIVSTNAGVRYRTVATVTVPRADLVGLTLFPSRIAVNVTAVEPGTSGNVEPNTIVIVPKGEDPQALEVVNLDATSGGNHEEFPQVAQTDVDGAVEQLTKALSAGFQTRLADSSIAPSGATVFSETASLGEATPSVNPASLVGQEVETFELGMSATGTVVTVNPDPVTAIADELLRATVEPGHELVAGSIDVEVGAPVVSGQSVAFSATATGEQVAILDPGELRKFVLGKPLDDAREILAAYGDVELTAWPEWVRSVPTLADRVDVRVGEGVPVVTPAPAGSTS